MIRRRHIAPLAAAAAAALMLAGCGGGGGGGGDAAAGDSAALPDASMPIASGVGAAESANQAIAALGTPGAVDAEGLGHTLAGFDRFGSPHDAFDQQVDQGMGSGTEPGSAAEIPADTPINGDPIVATPLPGDPATDPDTGSTPDPSVPVQNPLAMEADFDVSGEPVVAREGDAIPPDTQQFVVQTIGQTSVTLQLSGGLLPDGSDTVELDEGESITLYNATAKRSYKIKLVDVRRA